MFLFVFFLKELFRYTEDTLRTQTNQILPAASYSGCTSYKEWNLPSQNGLSFCLNREKAKQIAVTDKNDPAGFPGKFASSIYICLNGPLHALQGILLHSHMYSGTAH